MDSFIRTARRTAFVAAAFAALAVAAGAATSVQRTLESGDLTRTYRLYRPASLAPGAHPPLVVVLHGYGGNGAVVEGRYGFDDEADAAGFLVAYPDGYMRGWNSGNCCQEALAKKVDDVKFLSSLVEHVVKDEGADPRRVYFAGMSNGALMSYRMACEATIPIAAIAPVAGTLDTDCPLPRQTSVIAINGSADGMIPYIGGKAAAAAGQVTTDNRWRRNLPPTAEVMTRFRELDGCERATISTAPPVTTDSATCKGGRAVSSILVTGLGHEWPGAKMAAGGLRAPAQEREAGGAASAALNATHAIWQFFANKVSS
ncbi:MAG: polyhydroxybutyrate depolymerase [Candidatus Eremiobacteraeota bacterium]|nr:polyhydroxybutyrate depolymerase [Candidatus Eremiobacteraeota bacterium]